MKYHAGCQWLGLISRLIRFLEQSKRRVIFQFERWSYESFQRGLCDVSSRTCQHVYMLWNLEVTVGGLQLSLASKVVVVEQSETMMDSSSDVQLYPEGRLGLSMQQGSTNRYSYGRENSHRSCVDQGDHWVIKFRLGLNLFDLIKMWIPWGGYGEEGVRWRWSQVCSIVRRCEHKEWWLFSDLDVFKSRGDC